MPRKTTKSTSRKLKKEEKSSFLREPSIYSKLSEWNLESSSLLQDKKWIIKKPSPFLDNFAKAQNFISNKKVVIKKYIKKRAKKNSSVVLDHEYFYKKLETTALLFLDNLRFQDEEMEKIKMQKYLSFWNQLLDKTTSSFENFPEYYKLIDFKKLQEEISRKTFDFQKESVFSELVKLNLSRECEKIEERITDLMEKLSDSSAFKEILQPIQFKGWKSSSSFLFPQPPKKITPLDTSIPYLFLKNYIYAQDSIHSGESHLSPQPQWIQFIAKKFEKWSILRHIDKEEINKKMEGARTLKVSKEYAQWTDPEEKWFYQFLPLLNLYFDRFREKYINTSITTWDEPEVIYPLTEVESGETLSFSEDYKARPIFKYPGIPDLRIGGDLNIIEDILNYYEEIYNKNSAESLKNGGLAIDNSTIDLADCLKNMKEECSDV